ncbi:MAG: calcium/sodium antiporter [Syntrophotaleaceae bacterium]
MDWQIIMFLFLGFAILIGGAEFLVGGASRLALDLGLSPLVVGLTIVAFGTSSPELAVSLFSSHGGQSGLALGNVVGSNICNILLILGVSALIAPLVVSRQIIQLEVPIMLGASLVMFLFCLNGSIAPWEGLLLFAGAIVYTIWTIRRCRREHLKALEADPGIAPEHKSRKSFQLLKILAGLIMLGLGSRWLVSSAVDIARFFQVSDLVIGLTIVAVGTSLPELATSALAALRGQRDIAVGNVVGSNLFNILIVLGLTAGVTPGGLPVPPSALLLDLPVMLAVSAACLPIFFTGHRIARWEGGLFFCYFLLYNLFIILNALEDQHLGLLVQATTVFIIPLTLVTLVISLWRHLHRSRISS